MVALSRSRNGKRPPTGRLVGTPVATITSVALLVTVLLVVGCGQTTLRVGTSASHATLTPTSAVVPGRALSWTAGSFPPGNPMLDDSFWFVPNQFGSAVIAPSDGNIAYACMWPASASVGPGVWVTHDRAQHWMQVAPLPLPPVHRELYICALLPDAADPSMVVAGISSMRQKDLSGAPPQVELASFTDFVSFDGGAHWQLLRGPGLFMPEWVATFHGTTVAVLESGDGSVNLWMSTDQMQSWRKLPQAPRGQYFMNPSTGDLLVLGEGNGNPEEEYESSDLDQHWTSFPMPLNYSAATQLVSFSVGDPSWHMCGDPTSTPPEETYMCSMDGGRTWTPRPELGGNDIGLAPDSTIYNVMGDNVVAGVIKDTIPPGLYQLLPQSTRWQSLNSPPSKAVPTSGIPHTIDTVDIPGSGILWAVPGNPNAAPTENHAAFSGLFPATSALA